ncbi:MAG: phosphate signaling complex protein PhoU [Chitinophagaceae bacterium]|nr:MAG: phosphate signaling complex protein PhoU [Chitinophagaceae bacterium]
MTQLENELKALKSGLIQMWDLAYSQLEKAQLSLINFDQGLAREVMQKEKRVNGYELKIDTDCENIFALYTPVAVDLRFVLAVLKINYNLERIGDYAEGIARYVITLKVPFNKDILAKTQLTAMLDSTIGMVRESKQAFEKEDVVLARSLFQKDETLDIINRYAGKILNTFVENDTHNFHEALYVHSIIQKLERVGDQITNIAEEIIFYLEARVLKHKKEK